jgi:ADP-ribose pyrophosphatase YjhB (NUDIX family)
MRPGWGVRHPDLEPILAAHAPSATVEVAWRDGTLPLRASAYTSSVDLPDEILTSVRCMVQVDEQLLVCTTASGSRHPWPGGRREAGESIIETARREVHEETGWLIDPASFRVVGWLHLEYLSTRPADWPYPHPDFLQLVGMARADLHGPPPGPGWSDTEGWEVASELVDPRHVPTICSDDIAPLCVPFLPAV